MRGQKVKMLENHTNIFGCFTQIGFAKVLLNLSPLTITELDVGASSMLMHRINVGFTGPRLTDNAKDFTFFNIKANIFKASTRVAPS